MSGAGSSLGQRKYHSSNAALGEGRLGRYALTILALAFLGFFLLVPLFIVFHSALSQGLGVYAAALSDPSSSNNGSSGR